MRRPASRLQDGFNLRTSEEKDEIERSRLGGFDASIHISMRERPRHDGANKIALAVSIHAPLREQLNVSVLIQAQFVVSIHAPVRERRRAKRFIRTAKVSIHAPVRERPKAEAAKNRGDEFQFTLREGATKALVAIAHPADVSIHALCGRIYLLKRLFIRLTKSAGSFSSSPPTSSA